MIDFETIEELADRLRDARVARGQPPLPPATPLELERLYERFQRIHGRPVEPAYLRLMAMTNGVAHNGLVIWPCRPYGDFLDDLVTANNKLRPVISYRYLFYGQRGDTIFAHEMLGQHLALNLLTMAVEDEYADGEQMLADMLRQALEGA